MYSGASTVSPHVWLGTSERRRVSKEGGEQKEGRECMRERKDESNALQQRTVTDQAFIWAETAAVAGRTQQQCLAPLYHSVPPPQLETRWTQRGGGTREYTPGAQHLSNATSKMISGILYWLFQLFLAACQYPFPPETLQSIHYPLLCLDLKGVLCQRRAWLEWESATVSLYRSDIKTSRRLERHSAHYANLLSTLSVISRGFITALCLIRWRQVWELSALKRTHAKFFCIQATVFFLLLNSLSCDCWVIQSKLGRIQGEGKRRTTVAFLHEAEKTATKMPFHCLELDTFPLRNNQD